MRKYADGIWMHKKHFIIAKHGGYVVSGCDLIVLNVYKTLHDAVEAINKIVDGTHKTEPRIIGVLYHDGYSMQIGR